MKISTILKRAKKLIEAPERWIKNHYAKAGNGNIIVPNSRSAKCFCTVGAVAKVCGVSPREFDTPTRKTRPYNQAVEFLGELVGERYFHSVAIYNDIPRRTHEQVMKFMDKAIEKAEAQEKGN